VSCLLTLKVLHVEANCRNRNELPIVFVLEEIDYCGFSAVVEAHNQNANLLRASVLAENLHEHLAEHHFPEFVHVE
jgi:hypothetical protein